MKYERIARGFCLAAEVGIVIKLVPNSTAETMDSIQNTV